MCRVNYAGKVVNLAIFLVFNIIFWGVSLNHYYLVRNTILIMVVRKSEMRSKRQIVTGEINLHAEI
jgi:hypothetical protein